MVKHQQKVLESYLTGFITGSRVLTKSFVLVKHIKFSQDQFREKQAGAELCQAQASLPIKVVTFGKLRTL